MNTPEPPSPKWEIWLRIGIALFLGALMGQFCWEQGEPGLHELDGRGFNNPNGLAGLAYLVSLLTAVLTFVSLRLPGKTAHEWLTFTVKVGLLVLGTTYVTSLITVLHFPSGH